ncbi:hypothetical protein CKA32_002113 [Geitlerinema sp. FC II]|nr:hypothetical protein CKA32_002113 [Geitlerinema sp. FC II]
MLYKQSSICLFKPNHSSGNVCRAFFNTKINFIQDKILKSILFFVFNNKS